MSPSADPVALLSELVSFRTDCAGGDERALAARLAELLERRGPDEVTVADVPRADGKPGSYVYARFGRPRLLVNAHLDTVPPNADWSSDPFAPRIEGDRLYALGAADTKGAIAAILAALDDARPVDTGVLFSGDEEFSSVVMRAFVAGPHRAGLERAIVCEPTNLAVGVRHRGFTAFEVGVSGPGGHSSQADTLPAPIATLARVAVALDDWGRGARALGPPGFPGMCLNLARLDGGVAFNVIPAAGRLLVSLRPPPGADTAAVTAELEALVRAAAPEATFTRLRDNAPFATRDLSAFEPLLGAPARAPIDLGFWTEAAVLASSGVDAVVLGPGDITQAHAPDEWVSIAELSRARALFRGVFQARG
ncbi:MAG: M20/M25/M40 family metallo-hydrolase [Labilithrix sp.]|nr:M20/M25/M40 family metallo-hydrolase [Labilithrix sp.]MCW5832557.1 M20/M25/M40 family metallo-hydrolase [Labilithrix sp.]